MNDGIPGRARCTDAANLAVALTLRGRRFQRADRTRESIAEGAAHENFKKSVQKRTTTVDNTMTVR